MKTKDSSVNLVDLHPKMALVLPFLDRWWHANVGYELVVTSACDGEHGQYSRHYVGCAVDIRTWTTATSGIQINRSERTRLAQSLRNEMRLRYGEHFQVLPEATHFHIAFKPKEAVTWAKLV